eukprot:TRINITY_DN1120_c1_g3_i1.p1 TRINITY_DN1120_c1_g3~~TRINITY_DN1120_c1_g3_i1.p1  ORF type:complete len:1142 (+),score=517.52 TRINITY_DN1120_c1_g3_i1:231-3656(+)
MINSFGGGGEAKRTGTLRRITEMSAKKKIPVNPNVQNLEKIVRCSEYHVEKMTKGLKKETKNGQEGADCLDQLSKTLVDYAGQIGQFKSVNPVNLNTSFGGSTSNLNSNSNAGWAKTATFLSQASQSLRTLESLKKSLSTHMEAEVIEPLKDLISKDIQQTMKSERLAQKTLNDQETTEEQQKEIESNSIRNLQQLGTLCEYQLVLGLYNYLNLLNVHYMNNLQVLNKKLLPELQKYAEQKKTDYEYFSKQNEMTASITFGVELPVILQRESIKIPLIVFHSIHYLKDYTKNEVGLFRLSGSKIQIDNFKRSINQGLLYDGKAENWDNPFKGSDPHVISGLLKLFFREMPNPLLTFELHQDFIELGEEYERSADHPDHDRIIPVKKLLSPSESMSDYSSKVNTSPPSPNPTPKEANNTPDWNLAQSLEITKSSEPISLNQSMDIEGEDKVESNLKKEEPKEELKEETTTQSEEPSEEKKEESPANGSFLSVADPFGDKKEFSIKEMGSTAATTENSSASEEEVEEKQNEEQVKPRELKQNVNPELLAKANVAISKLPEGNRNIFLYLLNFFSSLSANSNENKMDASNIALVIAPTILYSNTVDDSKATALDMLNANAKISSGKRAIELLLRYAPFLEHQVDNDQIDEECRESLKTIQTAYEQRLAEEKEKKDLEKREAYIVSKEGFLKSQSSSSNNSNGASPVLKEELSPSPSENPERRRARTLLSNVKGSSSSSVGYKDADSVPPSTEKKEDKNTWRGFKNFIRGKKDETPTSPLASPPQTPRASQPEETKGKEKDKKDKDKEREKDKDKEKDKEKDKKKEKEKKDKKEKEKEEGKEKDKEKEEKRPFEHRFLSQLTIRKKNTVGMPRNDGSFFEEQRALAKEKEEKEASTTAESPSVAVASPQPITSSSSTPLVPTSTAEEKTEPKVNVEQKESETPKSKEEATSPKKGLGFRTFSIKKIKNTVAGKSDKDEKHSKSEKEEEKKEKKEDKKESASKREEPATSATLSNAPTSATTTTASNTKKVPVIPVRSVSQDPEVLREAKALSLQMGPKNEEPVPAVTTTEPIPATETLPTTTTTELQSSPSSSADGNCKRFRPSGKNKEECTICGENRDKHSPREKLETSSSSEPSNTNDSQPST